MMEALAYSFMTAELAKLAGVKTELLPHQQRVSDRIADKNQSGLVVVHGLGSGKTLTSIAAQDRLGMPATVVVPASLAANYDKERSKHLTGTTQPVDVMTLQRAARSGNLPDNPLLIVDEAHRLRESGTKGSQAIQGSKAQKRLLLTGTPFYNKPSDISPLVNIAAGKRVLPSDEKTFNDRYITERPVHPGFLRSLMGVQSGTVPSLNPRSAPELKQHFSKYMDYYPGSKEDFPDVEYKDVHVPMSGRQMALYEGLEGSAPWHIRMKVRAGLPPSKKDTNDLNAFLNAVRQVTNSTAPFHDQATQAEEPKIDLAFRHLSDALKENDRSKAVVYSNYLGSGIEPYKRRLTEAGIPFGEFTGEMTKAKRDQLVQDYNDSKIRTLLLSSAGGEGLDLKGTRLMQILEPHWNVEKIKQVEGRGARYKSHSDLPPEERKILIEKYIAQRSPSGLLQRSGLLKPGLSADEYLNQRAQEKDQLISQFKSLLPQHE